MVVINISNPSAPSQVGFYDTAGYPSDVTVAGDYSYVADDDGGLLILRFTGESPTPTPTSTRTPTSAPTMTPTCTPTPTATPTPTSTPACKLYLPLILKKIS